jgi:hypothetical protein
MHVSKDRIDEANHHQLRQEIVGYQSVTSKVTTLMQALSSMPNKHVLGVNRPHSLKMMQQQTPAPSELLPLLVAQLVPEPRSQQWLPQLQQLPPQPQQLPSAMPGWMEH